MLEAELKRPRGWYLALPCAQSVGMLPSWAHGAAELRAQLHANNGHICKQGGKILLQLRIKIC